MSYENELEQYVKNLEVTVVDLEKEIEKLNGQLKEAKRLISILDTQQQHVDLQWKDVSALQQRKACKVIRL